MTLRMMLNKVAVCGNAEVKIVIQRGNIYFPIVLNKYNFTAVDEIINNSWLDAEIGSWMLCEECEIWITLKEGDSASE